MEFEDARDKDKFFWKIKTWKIANFYFLIYECLKLLKVNKSKITDIIKT